MRLGVVEDGAGRCAVLFKRGGQMKFIHAADIHLDSPLKGLQAYEGAPVNEVREAPRRALVNLVDLSLSEGVDFVLIAGDLFDGDWKDYNTGLFFTAQMSRLRDAKIPVFIVSGNHDAASRITKSLRFPENVRVFSSRNPQTVILDDIGAAIHGQGYASRAVTDDLSAAFPGAVAHCLNIGLLHTSLDGRPGHETYAPTTTAALISKGYDYWALGHVHAHEIVRRKPWIVFSGNIQGRTIRESGPKGCVLVTAHEDGELFVEHRALDVMRWVQLRLDGSRAEDFEDLIRIFSEMLIQTLNENDLVPLAVRLEVEGADLRGVPEDQEEVRAELRSASIQTGGGRIWLEKVRFYSGHEQRYHARDFSGVEALSVLLDTIEGLKSDGDLMAEAIRELKPLSDRLPFELKSGDDALHLEEPQTIRAMADDVRRFLIRRLLSAGNGA